MTDRSATFSRPSAQPVTTQRCVREYLRNSEVNRCEQSLSSLFSFAGHIAFPVHNSDRLCALTRKVGESVDLWSRVPTGTVVEYAASIAAVVNAFSGYSL